MSPDEPLTYTDRIRAPVRDSKHPHGPKLVFRTEAWSSFVRSLKL
ncbi:DUF397 domain-containing protein [Streptomyces sp. NPDC002928]